MFKKIQLLFGKFKRTFFYLKLQKSEFSDSLYLRVMKLAKEKIPFYALLNLHRVYVTENFEKSFKYLKVFIMYALFLTNVQFFPVFQFGLENITTM